MQDELTHRARMENCITGEKLDRVPVALWRHFPVDDQIPGGLAAATIAFQRNYDFDFVKVTPASSFCIKDWGVDDEWCGTPEGTRQYTKRVVFQPEDWEKLPPLNPKKGHLQDQLKCLGKLVKELSADVPIIQTIFSPLSQAKNLAGGDVLLTHLRKYPDAVGVGLTTILESTLEFIEAAKNVGIDGIFYAIQHAQFGLMSSEEYRRFGKEHDQQVLQAANDFWLNVLHLHGIEVMFHEMSDFPATVINWHDRETWPSLAEGKEMFPGVICGGLQRWDDLVLGTPEGIAVQAQDALDATGGTRFILGTGCVTPITAPHGNIMAVRQAVER